MKRPAFKVTGGVVCTLALVGYAKVLLEPYLPSSTSTPMITLAPNQKLPAPVMDIAWRSNIDDGLREAKAKDKGLLVFLADPTSRKARMLETDIFRDDEVVRFVRRHFVAVRINLDDRPEWEGFLFPLSRTQSFFVPGCTVFVTDPKGNVLADNVYRQARYPFKEGVQAFLVQAKAAVGARRRSVDFETQSYDQMGRDLSRIRLSPSNPLPEMNKFLQTVASELEATSGSFATGGVIQFRPLVLRVLMQQGRVSEALAIAKKAATSPIYDVIDGGFFEAMEWGEDRDIDTAKRSCRNALAAEVLAELACLTGDDEVRLIAMDTAKSLLTNFVQSDAFIGGRSNDVGSNRRSLRYSLTQAKLTKILSSKDIQWVQRNLLNRKDVGRELATFARIDLLQDTEFQRIRNILRLNLPVLPMPTRPDRTGIMGYVAARLYRVGMLLDRPDFIEVASGQADKCFSTVTTSTINRIYGQSEQGNGWLGSYLGVADAALADYITSGRIASLELAKRVFRLTTENFGVPGTSFLGCQDNSSTSLLQVNMPQLVDIEGESLSAVSMRIGYALSVLESDPLERDTLLSQVTSASGTLAPLLSRSGSITAGYFSVTQCALDSNGIVVTGGNSSEVIRRLSQRRPLNWIFPLVGPVRQDWKLAPNNAYEYRGNQVIGEISGSNLAKATPNLP